MILQLLFHCIYNVKKRRISYFLLVTMTEGFDIKISYFRLVTMTEGFDITITFSLYIQ
jgi:hypothetical protein